VYLSKVVWKPQSWKRPTTAPKSPRTASTNCHATRLPHARTAFSHVHPAFNPCQPPEMMSLAAPLTWSAQLAGNVAHGHEHGQGQGQGQAEGEAQGHGQERTLGQGQRGIMSDGIGIAKCVCCLAYLLFTDARASVCLTRYMLSTTPHLRVKECLLTLHLF